MPESDKHRELVELICERMLEIYSNVTIYKDLSDGISKTKRPLKIGGRIPDVYGFEKESNLILVGEAKTNLKYSPDTSLQIQTFLNHLKESECETRLFILALPSRFNDEARYFLHKLHREMCLESIEAFVLDEYETWKLQHRNGEYIWLLTC